MYASPITHAHVAELNLKRDQNEARFIHAADDKELPIDGICRGSQLINVVAGGTLVQDLAADHLTDIAHAGPGFSPIFHPVRLEPGSVLAKTVGANEIPAVRSMHHEAVGALGVGVERVGTSPDGVTEAIARDGGRVRGYQFHPEKSLETEAARAIFRSMNERAHDYAAH
jgi:putative glutamine amidotransferase